MNPKVKRVVEGLLIAAVISAVVAIAPAIAKTVGRLYADGLTIAGTSSLTGAVSIVGAQTVVATGGAITVSTSATSGASLCMAGSFQSLPSSGYSKGCFAYQLSNDTPYVSTATVTNTGHWKALY